MNKFLWLLLVLIVVILIILILEKLRRESTKTLEQVLYVNNNPKLYLELVNNNRLKLLYSKNTIEHFKLNAYLMMDDKEKILDSFKYLDTVKLSKGESLDYNMKKLSYFALRHDAVKSKEALDYILKNLKDESLKDESQMIYDIYINKDTRLIKKLDKLQNHQKGQVRGISLFRIAKLYYFDKNNKKAKEYLNESLRYLKETAYEKQVLDCLDDIELLNDY